VSMDRTDSESKFGQSKDAVSRLRELAVLNLARISYEEGEFLESITYYRTLMHDSNFFYESLSEQAWPFFMAGYPNRALGALYAATSPFFQDKFNPDSYFLGGVIYYWMCQFDSAKKGLAKFVSHTRKEGDELKKKTNAWNTLPGNESLIRYAAAYENAKSGVSSTNLGIGPRTRASIFLRGKPTKHFNSSWPKGFACKKI
jgi:tetratricopeptide (TPR) repeat protein